MKICNKCNEEYSNPNNFCSKCGNKLVSKSGTSKINDLNEKYKNTYGTWKVTTESDCEGRSTNNLGIYIGRIEDIALSLKDKCYYSLNFKEANIQTIKDSNVKGKVNVSLDIESNTWDLSNTDLIYTMKDVFKDRNVEIQEGSSFASFSIVRD